MQLNYSPAGVHPQQMDRRAVTPVSSDIRGPMHPYSGIQNQPSRPGSRNERPAYHLFPTSSQTLPQSPRTLQRESLQRAGSLHRRRSASLDESKRPHASTRAQRSPAPIRLNKANNGDARPMETVRELASESNAPRAKLPYRPRVSEDGGHGRSSSAPEDFTRSTHGQERFPPPRKPVPTRADQLKGLGLTFGDDRSAKTMSSAQSEAHRKQNRNLRLKIEKPLPPPPGETPHTRQASDQSNRSTRKTPEPTKSVSQSAPQSAVRSHQHSPSPAATPLMLTSTDEYFPLSADAKVRELMGVELVDHRRKNSSASPAPATASPSSRLQAQVASAVSIRPAEVTIRKNSASQAKNPPREDQESTPVSTPSNGIMLHHLPSTTFIPPSKADMSPNMMPEALRVGTHKKDAEDSKASNTASTGSPVTTTATASITVDQQVVQALAELADLAQQTENLFARHAKLRAERQQLSSEITKALRESKPGPDYVNTLLDQHMSLATITSSMDICLAKLKSLDCRKENAIAVLAAQAMSNKTSQNPSKATKDSQKEISQAEDANSTSPAAPMPSPTLTEGQVISMYQHMKRVDIKSIILPIMQTPELPPPPVPIPFNIRKDMNLAADDKELPRRMNIKGAKAAKILGIIDDEGNDRPASPAMFRSANYDHNHNKSKPSLTRLDVDFANKSRSPAPERPLPVPPPSARPQNAISPPAERPIHSASTKKSAHSTQDTPGPSTGSSRASSPDDREAVQTPREEQPMFNETKSPSIQTVHVYMGEPVMRGRMSNMDASITEHRLSHVGEDDLLDYYKDLQ